MVPSENPGPPVLSNSVARLSYPGVSPQEFARKRKKERENEKVASSPAECSFA